MKKTLFITMLAAALMGSGLAEAKHTTHTHITGADPQGTPPNVYYAHIDTVDGDANWANVTIEYAEAGDCYEDTIVYGGSSVYGSASHNTITMTGGKEGIIYGGYTEEGSADANEVYINGGEVSDIVFGGRSGPDGNANGNTVVIEGGQVSGVTVATVAPTPDSEPHTGTANNNTFIITGGTVTNGVSVAEGYETNDNHAYLVGKGGSLELDGATYTGNDAGCSLDYISVAATHQSGGTSQGNTVEICGVGASVASISTQAINFHLSDSQMQSGEAMLTTTYIAYFTDQASTVDTGLTAYNFYGDDVTDWTAYDGEMITLAETTFDAHIYDVETARYLDSCSVNIVDKDGNVLKQIKLTLVEGTFYLDFTNDDFSVGYQVANTMWASAGIVGDLADMAESRIHGAMEEGSTAVWAGGLGFFQRETQELRGYTYNGGGYAVGVQHAFSKGFAAGFAFGQSFGHFKAKDDSLTARERGIMPALTARYRCQGNKVAHILSGHVAYGDLRYTGDLRGETPSRMRWTDHALSAGLTAGAETKVAENTTLTPFVGLTYVTASQSSAHNGAVRYHDGKMHNLSIPVGVTLRHSMGSFTPEVSLAYRGDVARMDPRVRTATAEGETREIGARPGRNALEVNAGASYAISDSVGAYASYTFTCRSKANSHSVNAGLQMTF